MITMLGLISLRKNSGYTFRPKEFTSLFALRMNYQKSPLYAVTAQELQDELVGN
jgi:hypothetical protein